MRTPTEESRGPSSLRRFLDNDPFLADLYATVRNVGAVRSISVDITHVCNIRCQGCYFFADGEDRYTAPADEQVFDRFVERELQRGTNFVTVIGGEPRLMLSRLEKLHEHFWMMMATNGLRKIPMSGFEDMRFSVSVWGDHETDVRLRGGGKIDVFARALKNYRNDPRVQWYYTVTSGTTHEIERVVEQCVENGNSVFFNFYGDIAELGGRFDHENGFAQARHEIRRMVERYPDRILMPVYVADVVSRGSLFGEQWGHAVCTIVSVNHPINFERLQNGHPYNKHFIAYAADLDTPKRCCGSDVDRDCSTCFDSWAHMSWIMLNMRKHMSTRDAFENWLASVFSFYLVSGVVDFAEGIKLLPELNRRQLEINGGA
jgi:MoaA/NifB/PqqE/SkfB family radical SAM enzyme